MEPKTGGATARRTAPFDAAASLRFAAVLGVTLLLAVSLLLAARRAAGALAEPLELPPLLATAVVAAGVAWALRRMWCVADIRDRTIEQHFVRWGPTLALALVGVALSLPQTPLGALLLWAILVGEEVAALVVMLRRARRRQAASAAPSRSGLPTQPQPDSHRVLMQMTRLRDAEGRDVLHGTAEAEFLPGQRTAALHLAFCPPFAQQPELEVFQVEGPELRVKVCQLMPYGVRLDLRLTTTPAAAAKTRIEFTATGEPLPEG